MEEECAALHANHTWDRAHLKQMWSLESGFSATSFLPMALLTYTKLAGFFAALLSALGLTTTKHSVPSSSQLLSALSSHWLIPRISKSISSTSKTLFFMGHCLKLCTAANPPVLLISLPDHVCKLNKSLYGLKQAPRAWYNCFATYLFSLGFTEAKSDTSLFVFR
jgi:hypothetical protein